MDEAEKPTPVDESTHKAAPAFADPDGDAILTPTDEVFQGQGANGSSDELLPHPDEELGPEVEDAPDEDLDPRKELAAMRTALPPRLERWRRRSAAGAILTGIGLGLKSALEPERDEPSIVMQASGDPPTDLSVEAELGGIVPADNVVRIRPWLLTGPDPSDEVAGAAESGGRLREGAPGEGHPSPVEPSPAEPSSVESSPGEPSPVGGGEAGE